MNGKMTNNIGIFGESAGGHIAMMVAFGEGTEIFTQNMDDLDLNYVIDVYGPTDLESLYHMQTVDSINALMARLPDQLSSCLDIAQHLFGFNPDEDSVKARNFMNTYSPINFVAAESPPTLMIHGKIDQIVPVQQTLILKERLDSMQVENEIHILENTNHSFMGASKENREGVQKWIVQFVKKHYQSDSFVK